MQVLQLNHLGTQSHNLQLWVSVSDIGSLIDHSCIWCLQLRLLFFIITDNGEPLTKEKEHFLITLLPFFNLITGVQHKLS